MKARTIRRLLTVAGLLFAGKAMARTNTSPGSQWNKGDFVGKKLIYKSPGFDGSFQFEPAHRQVVADVGAAGGIALPCHWRLSHNRLELYEQEEVYWSFALMERKPHGFVVKDNDGKVLELEVAS